MQKRDTKQKQIVEEVLHDCARPLTVQEILEIGQKTMPNLGIATIYRSIKRLSEAGDIQMVAIPGDPVRYEMCKHHHHHFKCNGCNKVYELEGCLKELKTLVPRGFKMQDHELTFYGLCRVCA